MPLPQLQPNGTLPPGLFLATLQEIFLHYPSVTPQRQMLDDALSKGLAIMWQHQLIQRVLIDGSYSTNKQSPGDVDMAVLTPGLYQGEGEQRFAALGIDMLSLHIQFAHDANDFDQWIDFFSYTTTGTRKGVIEIEEGI